MELAQERRQLLVDLGVVAREVFLLGIRETQAALELIPRGPDSFYDDWLGP